MLFWKGLTYIFFFPFCLTGNLLPQYFYVPHDQIELERQSHGSAERVPSEEGSTSGVFLWGQSIYFISQLLGKSVS